MTTRWTTLWLCGALALPLGAWAQQDAEEKEADGRLAEAAKQTAEACGNGFTARYAWGTEKGSKGRPASQGPVYCSQIIEGLRSACSDAETRAILGPAVKAVECRYEEGVAKRKDLEPLGGAAMKLKGTTLDAAFDWNTANLDSAAHDWATKKLLTPWGNGLATVEQKKEKAEGERRFQAAVEALNTACGTKLAVAYDWSSEKASPAKPAWQGFLYCKNVLDGVASLCGDDAKAKAKLAAKVKSIACRYSAGADKDKSLPVDGGAVLQIKGSALDVSYDWPSANLEAQASVWLKKKL